MRWLVIGNSNTGDQRSPVLPPDAFQPFLRRCRLLGQFDDVANRIIGYVGVDGLNRLAIAAVETLSTPPLGSAARGPGPDGELA